MRRISIAVLAFAAVVACDSKPTAVDLSADAGNYVLRSLNDTVLPYTYVNSTSLTILIMSDTIFMGVDGRFTDRTHYKRTANAVTDFPADTTNGTWTEKGATVTFSGDDGSALSATFSGPTLVFNGNGLIAKYTK